jgi:hypothetical protein
MSVEKNRNNLQGLIANDIPVNLIQKSKKHEPVWKDFTQKSPPDQKPPRPVKNTSPKAGLETQSESSPLLMAHYLPWYQTPDVSGYWGNHWTMRTCDPENIDPLTEQRDICSHYYPLVGPYDSIDEDLIDYHITLMKLAGVDGIIIDWYGVIDAFDWGVLRRSTDIIMRKFNDAGMKVVIMYEDYTIKAALQFGLINNDIAAGKEVMAYIERNYFTLPNYLRINGEPLLLNFGPVHFKTHEQWQNVFSGMTEVPDFSALGFVGGTSATTFPWIPWPTWKTYLQDYYAWVKWAGFDLSIGSAYFGFHDYYAEGGWGTSLYELKDTTGTTFVDLLNYNAAQNPDIIQLNTWNDYGEGTMLEPTFEFGYKYLLNLQSFTGVPYSQEHLELATEYYLLQKSLDTQLYTSSSQNFRDLLLSDDLDTAKAILDNY